jgi:hypothetical protein
LGPCYEKPRRRSIADHHRAKGGRSWANVNPAVGKQSRFGLRPGIANTQSSQACRICSLVSGILLIFSVGLKVEPGMIVEQVPDDKQYRTQMPNIPVARKPMVRTDVGIS